MWHENRGKITLKVFGERLEIHLKAFFIGQNRSVAIIPPPHEGATYPLKWQRSSGVEQRTHKPFVGGSIPPVATTFFNPRSSLSCGG